MMADEEIKCQCGLSILVEWRPATSAATYLASYLFTRRMDASGNWESVETLGTAAR
jgi:hypothetical protein